jgi:hypothetical protein
MNYRSINFRNAAAERRLCWVGRRDLLHVAAHRFGFNRLDVPFLSFNPQNIEAVRTRRAGAVVVYCQPFAEAGDASGSVRLLREIAGLNGLELVDGLEMAAGLDGVNAPTISAPVFRNASA